MELAMELVKVRGSSTLGGILAGWNPAAGVNRRKEKRFPVSMRCRTEEDDGMDERLIDISPSGCRFSSSVIFQEGDTVVINLPANARGRWISGRRYLLGRIVWSRVGRHQRTEYGVKVLN